MNASQKHQPTLEQKQVIESTQPAILVLAGAGSGKTATMTERIIYHVKQGNVLPEQVLGLTFTNKAAGELAQRVNQSLRAEVGADTDFQRPTISTYNSFAAQLAKSYAVLIGEDPHARLLTDGERWQIMENIVRSLPAQNPKLSYLGTASPEATVKTALGLAANIIDNHLEVEQVQKILQDELQKINELLEAPAFRKKPFKGTEASKGFAKLRASVDAIKLRLGALVAVEEYFAYKKANSVIEFADQISWAARIVAEFPFVGAELREKYRLILFDEYQDTSVNQAKFLVAAFQGAESICAVGDPNQAIYGWRGASANAFAEFMDSFRVENKNIFTLSMAFRNAQNILATANTTVKYFAEEPDLTRIYKDFAIQDDELYRPWLQESAIVQSAYNLPVPQLKARKNAPLGEVVHIHRNLREDSYLALAENIANAFAENCANDFSAAILVRKSRYVKEIESALQHYNVPYEIVSGEMVLQKPEIRLIRALLGVANDPGRNDLLLYLFHHFALGAKDIVAFANFAKYSQRQAEELLPQNISVSTLVTALTQFSEEAITQYKVEFSSVAIKRLLHIKHLVAEIRDNASLPVPTLIEKAIKLLNLNLYVAARSSGGATLRTTLDVFIRMATSYIGNVQRANLHAFLQWIDEVEKREPESNIYAGIDTPLLQLPDLVPKNGVVQILTVHAAKGLEWDLVAVPELVAGEFSEPTSRNVRPWHADTDSIPTKLRLDSAYVPNFSVTQIPDIFMREVGADADITYLTKGVAGCMFFDYLYRRLWKHQFDEIRRLFYVAITRPKHTLLLGSYDFVDLSTALNNDSIGKEYSVFLSELLIENSQQTHPFMRADKLNEPPISTPAELALFQETNAEKTEAKFATKSEYVWPAGVNRNLNVTPLQVPVVAQTQIPNLLARLHHEAQMLIKAQTQRAQITADTPYLTATDIVTLAGDSEQFIRNKLRPIPTKPLVATRRGIRVHKQIEYYFNRPSTLDLDAVVHPEEMPLGRLHDSDIAFVDKLYKRFTESRFAQLTPLAIEQAMEIVLADLPIRCALDAVFDTSTLAGAKPVTIVDWKTGKVPSENKLAARKYQLGIYRLAWARTHDMDISDIDACFYYLGENDPEKREVHITMPDLPDLERELLRLREMNQSQIQKIWE